MLTIPLAKFQELHLEDSQSEFAAILEEGKVAARTSLQATVDPVDSATCTVATAMTI